MDRSPRNIIPLVIALFFTWPGVLSYAQNLVPNPSYETLWQCPYSLDLLCWDFAPPWQCGNGGTSDLYNACVGGFGGVGVPNNLLGFQPAHSGDGYAGFLGTYITPNRREYVMVQLLEPLIAGTWYDLSFYLSLPEESCGIERIGAYFSVTSPYIPTDDPLPVIPQIETNYGFLDDMVEWMLITGCYQALGGEVYLTIGNYHDDASTPLDPNCDSSFTYYFIDDVSLTVGGPPEVLDIDLNGPVTECFSFEIDPEHAGPYYTWSNGSHEPTIVVTSSGEVTVTITDGCDVGVGSIDVTILDSVPEIDIGPPDITICNGDAHTISLDPDWGDIEWHDGSEESEYIISTPGIYTVTVSNICSSSSDQINVVVAEPPAPIDLGDDVILCVGDEIQLTLDPALGEFEWQDQSTTPVYTITEGGEYAVTVSNLCGEVTDEITVTSLNLPEIDLGDDELLLCTGDIVDIALDPEAGTYLWQDGSIDIHYSITAPGIYAVTVTNSCGSSSDQIEVEYYDVPVFELGPDTLLCPGDTMILDGDGVTGTYQWQDHSQANTINVTSGGTYSLTLTTGCGTATDSIHIAYASIITPPNLGENVVLCPGESHVLLVTDTSAAIVWQDGSTADSLLVTAAGTYFVTVQNACASFSDTIQVIVNADPPQLDLPATVALCQGETTVLDANVPGVNYLWNDASQSDSLLVSTPGIYSVTISNACGTDADTVVVIDSGPPPFVLLGNDVALCPGDTLVIHPLSGNVNTWLWQDGAVDSIYTVTTGAVVSVIASNPCGTVHDTLLATLLPATPPLSLGNDTSFCPGQSLILSIPTPDVSIVWSDGSGNNQIIMDQPGIVHATISNACGHASDTIEVHQLPPVPPLNLGMDQSLCPGETIVLNPGIDSVNYVWQDGSVFPSFNATEAGIIHLTIFNSCGASSDTIIITESTEGPQVSLGPDILGCEGDVVTLVSDISGVAFAWQDGSSLPSFTTTTSGTFILTVSNNCGMDVDTVLVELHGIPPQTNLGADTLLCEGSVLLLASTADAETTVTWQDGSNLSIFMVTSPGTYHLQESNRCGNHADTIHVEFKNTPGPFDLGPDTTLCPGNSITLIAPFTTDDLTWQDGSSGTALIADREQVYSLLISNECGTVSDQLHLTFDHRIPTVQLDPETALCPGESVELDVTQLFPAQYQWNTGHTLPVLQISSPGNYAVSISSPCAATSGATEVMASDSCFTEKVIFIPNAFSPNGDNVNDFFSVSWNQELDIRAVHTSIFDRWGNLVYDSNDVHARWRGDFHGRPLQPGVFVYQVVLQYVDKGEMQEQVLHGDVTIIR